MSDAKFDAEGWVDGPIPKRTDTVDKLKSLLAERRKRVAEGLAMIDKAIDDVNSVQFLEGDVVLTKSGDKGIICGIGFGDNEAMNIPAKFSDKVYATLATKNGYKRELVEELIPINNATKVLYEK